MQDFKLLRLGDARKPFDEVIDVCSRFHILLTLHGFSSGSDEHLHAVLELFDLKRLTTQVGTVLLKILERNFPHVEEFLKDVEK